MATRFYFEPTSTPSITPTFDSGWEQTGQAIRRNLTSKTRVTTLAALADGTSVTVPITTTQDILDVQFISEPIPTQRLIGTVSVVIRCDESTVNVNAFLAVVIKVISNDGTTSRGTIFSNFSNGTEITSSNTTSASTKIVNAQALTEISTQPGDRILVEVGANAAAPIASGTYLMRFGYNAASDFALTQGLTTDLNPWIEFSQNLWASDSNNYQFIKVGDGMSASEKIR